MRPCLTFLVVLITCPARADGPADNIPENVRRIPKPGIAVPDADRQELEGQLASLAQKIALIRDRPESERIDRKSTRLNSSHRL